MERRLQCFQMLSLKEMCMRKVVLLCSGSDITAAVSEFRLENFPVDEIGPTYRAFIEDNVKAKILELRVSEKLIKPMFEIIRPIFLELRKWWKIHEDYFVEVNCERIPVDVRKLCWTAAGSIDYGKSAEELVRSEELKVEQRYHLACLYCVEDTIPLLWVQVPEWMKIHKNQKIAKPHLSYCWNYILKGELRKLDYLLSRPDGNRFSFNQCAFEYSAENGHTVAAKFFFNKLSLDEKEESLSRTVSKVIESLKSLDGEFLKENFSRLLFILFLMSPEEQMAILEAQPIEVWFSFLDWPHPELFIQNAGLFWTVLPPDRYGDLLEIMDARYAFSDFYVPILFRDLFVKCPLEFKRSFLQSSKLTFINAMHFITRVIDYDDAETIGVILKNLDAAERKELFFYSGVLMELNDSVAFGKWNVVNVCLREITLSKEDKERLKKIFMDLREGGVNRYFSIDNWTRLFELLN